MRTINLAAAILAVSTMGASGAMAQTQIQWWHAMGGANGERIDKIAADFNATQDDVRDHPDLQGLLCRDHDGGDRRVSRQ